MVIRVIVPTRHAVAFLWLTGSWQKKNYRNGTTGLSIHLTHVTRLTSFDDSAKRMCHHRPTCLIGLQTSSIKRLKVRIELLMSEPISELRSVTCHMGSHSVTCHPTEVNAPRLNPSQIGRYSIYLPRSDGRLSWPSRLVTSEDGLPAHRQSPIAVLTAPGVQ